MLSRIRNWWKDRKFVEESWLLWDIGEIDVLSSKAFPWSHTVGTYGFVDINVPRLLAESPVLEWFVGVLHLHSPSRGTQLSETDYEWVDGWRVAMGRPVMCAVFDGTNFLSYQEEGESMHLGRLFHLSAVLEVPGFALAFPRYEEFADRRIVEWLKQ